MTAAPAGLTPVTHHVTESQIARYADAAGDHNPLHLDAEFAASTPYGRPIAHGMLVLAFVSEMLTRLLRTELAVRRQATGPLQGAGLPGRHRNHGGHAEIDRGRRGKLRGGGA